MEQTKRGGAREGAGRKALYGEPLTAIVAVQLNEKQMRAVIAYAKRNKVNVALLLRESALIAAGAAKLGVGLNAADAPGWAEVREVTKWPVKFTAKQHEAITRAADKVGITLRQFVLEAVLAYIKRPELGERGEMEQRMKALGKLDR